jgi:hypothetical protein
VYATIPEDMHAMLEIGVYRGASLRAWLEIFPRAEIYGADHTKYDEISDLLENPRIHFLQCWGMDVPIDSLPFLDLVVDDADHLPEREILTWERLRAKAGTYVIEDLDIASARVVWDHVASAVPTAQILLWRTSELCGDGLRLNNASDSHCLMVRP